MAATEVEEIVRAEWRDLGMPETLWNCRVKEFGPTYRINRYTGQQYVRGEQSYIQPEER